MKKFAAGFIAYFFILSPTWSTSIAPKQNNVSWNKSASWNLNRLPQNGDTVIIPAGITVVVNNDVYTTTPNLFIKVSGIISFQPNGKIDLGPNSVVEILAGGEIISNNTGSERIVIGGTLKYKGNNDGKITGYALANAASPASGSGPGSGFLMGTLVVNLKNFQAVKMNGKVYINWQTASESEADYFEVQRTENQTDWKTIYHAKAYNDANGHSYTYIDSDPLNHDTYFRLKSVQKNGDANFSMVSFVKNENSIKKCSVYPNPTADYVIVSFSNDFKKGIVKLISFDGQLVQSKPVTASQGFVKLDMSQLPNGTYIMELDADQRMVQTEKIVVRGK